MQIIKANPENISILLNKAKPGTILELEAGRYQKPFFGKRELEPNGKIKEPFTKDWEELQIEFDNDAVSHPDFPDWLIRCGYSITNGRGIDPEFCDPRNGDFKLQKNSPLIGEAREIVLQLPNENHVPTRIKLEYINDIGAYQGDHIVEGPKFVYYLEPKD